jgi:ubiquinone/menaquinone biosynthesis C-methylase UbiE
MTNENILIQNKTSWNAIADSFFGVTALPTYGVMCPTEDDLHLFPDLNGKKVLDIGCGSGHSLKWCANQGASELCGLDISENQLANTKKVLAEIGVTPKLFCSPMEQNPGIPLAYFDVVYSIYAIGWTVDLQTTFNLISSYLKPGGTFIFSNALATAGFAVERVVEEADKETLERECEFSSRFYSAYKAKHFPLSLIVKARKL